MKKDFFNGNIKRKFVSYIWTSIIIIAVSFFGCSGLFLYCFFAASADNTARILLLVLCVVSFLLGVWYSFGTIFIIRKYPKYKKITKWFLNTDYYFVGSDSKEFYGHWRGKSAFAAVISIADQNEIFINIKYPKKYYAYIWATAIGIILMFVDLISAFLCLSNIEKLPQCLQNEGTIFIFFMLLEVIFMVISAVFAFRVKKVREITRKEYSKKR